MTKQDVIQHYGSVAAAAEAMGIRRQAVNAWGEEPPHGRQCELQILTRGKLKASPKRK